MPAKPDLPDDGLSPWAGEALSSGFEIEDMLVSGSFQEARAAGGRILRSRLERVALTGARLRSLVLTDVLASGLEASGGDWTGGRLRRVEFAGGRLAGLQLVEADVEDVVFRDCRLELATFRGSKLRNAVFERCVLDEADFFASTLQAVRFDRCRLVRTDFSGATLKRVDLRGSELDPAGDVNGLRGAIVDSIQLAGLAPLLARAAGITVDDG
jgi:fluoroquinolone resistance protein